VPSCGLEVTVNGSYGSRYFAISVGFKQCMPAVDGNAAFRLLSVANVSPI